MPRASSACTIASVKCKPGRRRRNRALLAREHGLIVGAILLVGRAAAGDIGRQRHVAALGKRLVEHRAVKGEGKCDLAALPFGFDRSVELVEKAHAALAAETHDVAYREPSRGLDQSAPARAVETLDQRLRRWPARGRRGRCGGRAGLPE